VALALPLCPAGSNDTDIAISFPDEASAARFAARAAPAAKKTAKMSKVRTGWSDPE
jgi:hypothetical protein